MWRALLQNLLFGRQSPQPLKNNRGRTRLQVERLDERVQPAAFTAGNVADLIADINAANLAGGSNTITLVAGATFQLSTVNNTTDGATGLPVVTANNNLTISGNGDVIQRQTSGGTPTFRLIDVAVGGSLTLTNLTLQGGVAVGSGGAILNHGVLNLNGVAVQNNVAKGMNMVAMPGGGCAGGGIYSNGTLTLQNCTIQNNQAMGGDGGSSAFLGGLDGGSAAGGGIAIAGGTANLNNVSVISNSASGGNGGKGSKKLGTMDGWGGYGSGGGIFVGGATVTLVGTTVSQSTATGGNGFVPGIGKGGGIFINATAIVYLDAFTQASVNHNHASTSDPDIYGSFILS